ncbi:MAG: GDSL-type esterase/lipase family protein [Acidimicrobiia bacterium]
MRRLIAVTAAVLMLGACSSIPAQQEPTTTIESPSTTVARERTLLALGDSYTEGTAIDPADAWPAQLAAAVSLTDQPISVVSVAGEGWNTKRLDRELMRVPVQVFDEIVLAIGANDLVLRFGTENFVEGLQLLKSAIEARSGVDTTVTVMSIPDFRASPWGQERLDRNYDIEGYNEILGDYADAIGATFVDITTISAAAIDRPEFIASDGLHFSGEMYALWVQELRAAGVGSGQ